MVLIIEYEHGEPETSNPTTIEDARRLAKKMIKNPPEGRGAVVRVIGKIERLEEVFDVSAEGLELFG